MNTVLRDLKDNEFIYVFADDDNNIPAIFYKKDGGIYDYILSLFANADIVDPGKIEKLLETNRYKVCSNKTECMKILQKDYLEPQLYEIIISDKNKNYLSIKEDIDRFQGKYYRDGYYLVGAVSRLTDYYYLYWSPVDKDFMYSSCVGDCGIDENQNMTLPEKYLDELRKLVKENVLDAVFPSSYLQVYY